MARQHERVHFRLLMCPECSHLLCWVNPRFPTYCPECGELIALRIREHVMSSDEHAVLTREEG